MQHAWLLALLALPTARAIACECYEWRNGATAEDPALCRKSEGGRWMCRKNPRPPRPGAPSSGPLSGPLAKLSDKLSDKLRAGGSSKKLAVLPDNLVSNKV